MSRSEYRDDLDNWSLIRWRGQVASAIRGRRGQRLLRDLRSALEAMPVRVLIRGELEKDGQFCALGAVGQRRGLELSGIDAHDTAAVANLLNIAEPLAREIEFENDEQGSWNEPPSQRWERVYHWCCKQLQDEPPMNRR